ncbi:MAG: heavy-metal-associated domain-containing protein [Treponema sp.]|jgi:hypothetical protein|nr:heavy-metal-associated domain-containing protein [Treponema sp.]
MIVSFVPGRLRLRLPELKNQDLAGELLPQIQAVPGIKTVEIKTLTGSLLIEYDPSVISTKRLIELGRAIARRVGIAG